MYERIIGFVQQRVCLFLPLTLVIGFWLGVQMASTRIQGLEQEVPGSKLGKKTLDDKDRLATCLRIFRFYKVDPGYILLAFPELQNEYPGVEMKLLINWPKPRWRQDKDGKWVEHSPAETAPEKDDHKIQPKNSKPGAP